MRRHLSRTRIQDDTERRSVLVEQPQTLHMNYVFPNAPVAPRIGKFPNVSFTLRD